MGQFICSYLAQRDGGYNTAAYKADALQLYNILTPIFDLVAKSPSTYPNLLAALRGGVDGAGQPYVGLCSALYETANGQWPFSNTPPSGDNNTPGPWWDNPPQTPNWNYTWGDPYMTMIEEELSNDLKYNI